MKSKLINICLTALLLGLFLLTGCSSGRALPESQRIVGQARVNMRSGNTYLNYEEFGLALERFLEVLDENPEYIEALTKAADIYFFYAENQPEKAIEYYTESFEYYERAIEAYNKIKKEGNFPDIKEMVDDAMLKRRAAWARIFNAGQEIFGQGKTDEALELFYHISEMTPDSTNVYIMIATIYQTEDDHEQAADYFKRIATIDNTDTVSRNNLALHYFNNQNHAEAIRWYKEITEIEPDNPETFYNIGFVYLNMENHGEEALESFEKAYEIDNQFVDAAINVGFTAFDLQKYDKAIQYFQYILEAEPENTDVIIYSIYAFDQTERYEEMLTYAKQLYELDKQSAEAVQFIISAAYRLSRTDLTRKYLEILEGLE